MRKKVRGMKPGVSFIIILAAAGALAVEAAHAQTWVPARLLAPYDHDTKSQAICAAATGGFHYAYVDVQTHRRYYIRYYRNDTWTQALPIGDGGGFNLSIAESGGGSIWVVWEDWSGGGPNCTAAQSDHGGASWGFHQVSNFTGNAMGVKFPSIARLGGAYSHQVIATFANVASSQRKMYYNRFDGFRFLGVQEIPGGGCGSEYWATGSAHSPANGGVYRTYGYGSNVYVNFFNGTSWEGETQLKNDNQFFAWPDVAAAASGHVMVIWERDEKAWCRAFVPGQGWTETVSFAGHLPRVTAIADKPEFYMTYVKMPEQDRIMGRRWANGAWSGETRVSVGVPNTFSVQNMVASDRWGTVYCVWEHWGDGPQGYFSYTRDYEHPQTPTPLNTPQAPPTSTITPTFTNTVTRTFTLTPTITNTPRNQSPTATPTSTHTPTPSMPPVLPNLNIW